MTDPIQSIELQDVSFRYPGSREYVFRDLSVQINADGITVVTGANGTGKSTLALLLAGALQPSSGRILIDGIDIKRAGRKPGYLHQNPENQIIGLTCERDIAYGLENRAVPQPEMHRKVEAVLDALDIGHIRSKPVSEISGGEMQRVAIAGMLVMGHPYLVLDEPTSYLDYPSQAKLYEHISQLRADGTGILWITQYPNEQILGEDVFEITKDRKIKRKVFSYSGTENGATSSAVIRDNQKISEDLLVIRSLRFNYTDNENFSLFCDELNISNDSIVGWYGYSGSGKSTLAKIIAGILPFRKESVDTDLSEKDIIYVPQFPERFLYSGDLQQMFDLLALRPEFEPGKFYEILKSVTVHLGLRLENYENSSLWHVSAGELRRLMLAIAVALKPKLLILDEPTINMSEEHTLEIARIFTGDLVSTLICISHEYGFLKQQTQAGVYFHDGKVSQIHAWHELEQKYDYIQNSIFETMIQQQYAGAINS